MESTTNRPLELDMVDATDCATISDDTPVANAIMSEIVAQSVASTISSSSGLFVVDSTFINSVVQTASNIVTAAGGTVATVSSPALTNLTGLTSNVSLSMDGVANPGSFIDINTKFTTLFTLAVAAKTTVTPTNLENTNLNVTTTMSSAVSAVPAQQIGVISTASLMAANICFAQGTKIETDQGVIEIQKLSEHNTIEGEQIRMITKTKNVDDYMVVIKKDTFSKNVPNEDTYLTGEHNVLYRGKMMKAKDLVNGNNIIKDRKKSQIVYNVLLENAGKVIANNMVAESLDPSSPFIELLIALEKNTTFSCDKRSQKVQSRKL